MLFKRRDNELGKGYQDGEFIFRQGEMATCLYIILEGQVELITGGDAPLLLDVLGKDDMFGAISLFDGLPRPVSARARGSARVLTMDKKIFMQRLDDDPSLTYRILENMALRTRRYIDELVSLKRSLACDALAEQMVGRPADNGETPCDQHIPFLSNEIP
ncbi:MAG: cyclic nucleotide-binding domain-containing protein [Magnetococcales bacterium]|nr:cyclic nucleotide-binding domain-containing protein [Magnetococcales bacterium]NGZ26315.1 cyclic nucleotide-binding domain-containing protein [Magnetococcales bacterium]